MYQFHLGDRVQLAYKNGKVQEYKITKVGREYAYFGDRDHLRVPKSQESDTPAILVQNKRLSWAVIGSLTGTCHNPDA